ncbi:arylesterase [bacterium]|nr:arylesterase [bacterium]
MIGLGLLSAACGGGTSAGGASAGGAKKSPMANPGGEPSVPVESTTAAAPLAVSAAPEVVQDRTGAARVLFLGTSLTAGYGLDDPAHDSWPAVIQQIADSLRVPLEVVNAGLSGETSAGALRRTDWLLKQHADLVVIETGANDGLRGLNPDSTAANLRAIVGKIRAAQPGAKLLLVQMEAPTNLGTGYTREFHALYGRVAREAKIALSPFLLDGVAGVRTLNQADGIHPLPEGARRAARTLWPSIRSGIGRP